MRIKKEDVIKEINDKSQIDKNKRKVTDEIDDISNELKDKGFNDEDAQRTAVDIVTGEPVNEVGKDKVHTPKFDSCVADVKKQPDVDNPYAICQASLGADAIKKSHRKKEEEDYTNETTVSITKGKLLETILNKKPRKVVKTIRIGDLKK